MLGRWFISRTVRQATYLHKHVRKLLCAQRDILSAQNIEEINKALAEMSRALASGADKAALRKEMERLETSANKWLKPYPNQNIRENVEVALVAIAVAMGIRTFFLQPFKIPTGSMQPTLYGITISDLRQEPGAEIPNRLRRQAELCFLGTVYHELVAEADCEIVSIGPLEHVAKFINRQTLSVRYRDSTREYEKRYTLWLTPDDRYAMQSLTSAGEKIKKGDYIVRFKEVAGDHLFVDRLTYNFRRPRRGEIIVFETSGTNIEQVDPRAKDTFYIKRLVALGNEEVRIGDDRHLIIDGRRLEGSAPHFENVYSFDPKQPPRPNEYSGHLNEVVGRRSNLAPLFPNQNTSFTVRPHHYMAMGDNTLNSSDSRVWGDFAENKVMGKAFFVYWPFNKRFGMGYR